MTYSYKNAFLTAYHQEGGGKGPQDPETVIKTSLAHELSKEADALFQKALEEGPAADQKILSDLKRAIQQGQEMSLSTLPSKPRRP